MKENILRRLTRRPIPIMPKRLATSQYSGEWTSPYTGKGLEYRSHRPYQLGDDFRTIHMASTVRTGKKMVVERIVRRDISILVVLDCSASMGIRQKVDMLLATSLMLVYSGVSMEMRTGAALLMNDGYYRLGMGMGQRHGMRLFNTIENVCQLIREGQPIPREFPKMDISRLLPVGGILVYVSDFLDEKGYVQDSNSYSIEAQRYDFVPVVIQDNFEFSFPDLPDDTLLDLSNPETGNMNPVWLGQSEKKLIKTLHEKRFSDLQESFSNHGIHFIHINDPDLDQIHTSLTRFFVLR